MKKKNPKIRYTIYIKSHTEAPDFERDYEAENIIEALKMASQDRSLADFSYVDLLENMGVLDDSSKPLNLPFEDKVIQALKQETGEWFQRYLKENAKAYKKNQLLLKLQKFLAEKELWEEYLTNYEKLI